MESILSGTSRARAYSARVRGSRFRKVAAGLLAAFGVVIAATASAATTESTPGLSLHRYSGVALSPDGKQVADIESGGDSQAPHGVVVRNAANGKVVASFDPCAACSYDDPAWSPDGKSLVFVGSDWKDRRGYLWVAQGQALQTTVNFDGLLAKPRYSPDGKTLAVLATEHPSKIGDATAGDRASDVGDMDELKPDVRRIAVVEASSAKLRFVSPGDRYIYEYDWSPDGAGFAVTDGIGVEIYNEWYVAKLEYVDFATGAAHTLATPKMQIRNPRVSPDGKSVAFIGGLMDDNGEIPTGGDVWTTPIESGEPRNLTPGYKGTFNSLQRVGSKLYPTAVVFDRFILFELGKDGGLKTLWTDPNTILAGDGRVSLSADATRLATTEQSFAFPHRILAGRLKDTHPITHENDAIVSNTNARSITYANEGLTLQGWLLAPKNVQPGKTYPLATYIHGGPAHFQEARFHWDDDEYYFLQAGYFVFVPNFRGSFGQGLAFQRTIVMDIGGGPLRDILAGVDAVEKIAPIDDKRLSVWGFSTGGWMVQWATTQTDRFKAAAVSTAQTNWVNDFYLENIRNWILLYMDGNTPWDRPDLYDQLSPDHYVKQVKTPTLIYNGELDVEAPVPQAVEWWRALKAVGVPTKLIIYPGEGHSFANPANIRDVAKQMVAWFDKYASDDTQ